MLELLYFVFPCFRWLSPFMVQQDGVSPITFVTPRRQCLNKGDWMSSSSVLGPLWGNCTASGSGMTIQVSAQPGKHLYHAGLWFLLCGFSILGLVQHSGGSPACHHSKQQQYVKASSQRCGVVAELLLCSWLPGKPHLGPGHFQNQTSCLSCSHLSFLDTCSPPWLWKSSPRIICGSQLLLAIPGTSLREPSGSRAA